MLAVAGVITSCDKPTPPTPITPDEPIVEGITESDLYGSWDRWDEQKNGQMWNYVEGTK